MTKKNIESKCKHKLNKTKTIAFRVTEEEYRVYNNDPVMKALIQKYSRSCLAGISMLDFK